MNPRAALLLGKTVVSFISARVSGLRDKSVYSTESQDEQTLQPPASNDITHVLLPVLLTVVLAETELFLISSQSIAFDSCLHSLKPVGSSLPPLPLRGSMLWSLSLQLFKLGLETTDGKKSLDRMRLPAADCCFSCRAHQPQHLLEEPGPPQRECPATLFDGFAIRRLNTGCPPVTLCFSGSHSAFLPYACRRVEGSPRVGPWLRPSSRSLARWTPSKPSLRAPLRRCKVQAGG